MIIDRAGARVLSFVSMRPSSDRKSSQEMGRFREKEVKVTN